MVPWRCKFKHKMIWSGFLLSQILRTVDWWMYGFSSSSSSSFFIYSLFLGEHYIIFTIVSHIDHAKRKKRRTPFILWMTVSTNNCSVWALFQIAIISDSSDTYLLFYLHPQHESHCLTANTVKRNLSRFLFSSPLIKSAIQSEMLIS